MLAGSLPGSWSTIWPCCTPRVADRPYLTAAGVGVSRFISAKPGSDVINAEQDGRLALVVGRTLGN
jgi:hypothetical protein